MKNDLEYFASHGPGYGQDRYDAIKEFSNSLPRFNIRPIRGAVAGAAAISLLLIAAMGSVAHNVMTSAHAGAQSTARGTK